MNRRVKFLLPVLIAILLISFGQGVFTWAGAVDQNSGVVFGASDPVIGTAGDIACDPSNANFNNGNGASNSCREKYTSDLLVNAGLAGVLDLGDNQYYCGGFQAFVQSYDPSWGRLKSITHPSVGNHEYLTSGGTGCDSTNTGAAGYFQYFGAAAGNFGQGYYSFDIGTWHLIALNSNCSNAGGCNANSPQGKWLEADLNAHTNFCTLAFWHIPLYSSGGRSASNSFTFWQSLYNHNADLILNGHDHIYERFAAQTPTGVADPTRGIREFIVGTGGADHTTITTIAANSELRNANTYGVLKITLHPTSYDWQFVPEAGKTFTDSGSTACHGSTSATATPTATSALTLTSTATATTTATASPTATVPILTATPTTTRTFTPTATLGTSPTATFTFTPTATLGASPTATLTFTPTPTIGTSPTATLTPTATATIGASSTATFTPTATPTIGTSPTATLTPSPTATLTTSPTTTLTPTPTATIGTSPTATFTPSPTATITASPTATLTPTPTATPGTGLTFTPVADTYVNSASPTTNYGSSTTFRVDGSPFVNSYLRFTVQGLGNSPVVSAHLRVFANSSSSSGIRVMAVADNTWLENSIDYNNAPPMGALLGSFGAYPTGSWVTIDVTAYITGDGTYNFGIITPGPTNLVFASKEGAAGFAPQLVINN